MWNYAVYCGLAFVEATVFGASVATDCQACELGSGIVLGLLAMAPTANHWAERLFAPASMPTEE
jgi:hypothetical protein